MKYTIDQILKAAEEGEVSMIDARHICDILQRSYPYVGEGDLKGFPREVVEKMLERQFEQTGKRNVSVFEEDRRNCLEESGFNWRDTIEGFDFWQEVIACKNFDLFFQRYPK